MQRKIVLIAMLLMAVGSTLFMSGSGTKEKQAGLRITTGDVLLVLYNTTTLYYIRAVWMLDKGNQIRGRHYFVHLRQRDRRGG